MARTSEDQLLPAYLAVGTDELKRHVVVDRLKNCVPADLVDFNLDEFDARAIEDPETLRSSLETMPFGAPFRLVIVHVTGVVAKALSEMLVTYLAQPNPSCVLCLDADKLAKNTRLYKAVAKIGPHAVIECMAVKRWELPGLIAQYAQGHQVTITQDAAQELIDRSGESTVMLDNQVKLLADFIHPRTQIELSDVEAHIAQTAEVSAWSLADAVCERKTARALRLYHRMNNPSQVYLHTVLVGRLRELICAKSLAQRGASNQLASELKRAPWQVKNHTRWAQRFTLEELCADLSEAAECERMLKGSGDSETAFVKFLVQISGGVQESR